MILRASPNKSANLNLSLPGGRRLIASKIAHIVYFLKFVAKGIRFVREPNDIRKPSTAYFLSFYFRFFFYSILSPLCFIIRVTSSQYRLTTHSCLAACNGDSLECFGCIVRLYYSSTAISVHFFYYLKIFLRKYLLFFSIQFASTEIVASVFSVLAAAS